MEHDTLDQRVSGPPPGLEKRENDTLDKRVIGPRLLGDNKSPDVKLAELAVQERQVLWVARKGRESVGHTVVCSRPRRAC